MTVSGVPTSKAVRPLIRSIAEILASPDAMPEVDARLARNGRNGARTLAGA